MFGLLNPDISLLGNSVGPELMGSSEETIWSGYALFSVQLRKSLYTLKSHSELAQKQTDYITVVFLQRDRAKIRLFTSINDLF